MKKSNTGALRVAVRATLPLLLVVVVVVAMMLALGWLTTSVLLLLLVLRLLAVFFELVFCLIYPSQQQNIVV